ncbi:MAG TPA: NADH-quinone oxidoreductase subunit M [Bacteroidetes bacterium]|nr:NADH-quinone oxidoreductase subunit M [Bacteroidota bacterium]
MGWLTILLLIPLLAMLASFLLPTANKNALRFLALGATLIQAVAFFAFVLPQHLHTAVDEFGFATREITPWIHLNLGNLGELDIQYHLGLDGLSLVLVMLTVIIMPIATLASWKIEKRVKAYFALLLLLNMAMLGCFMALDFFLFYLFYELMLLPMFFLIGMWGGARREYAAIKFFLYTLFGSVFMLLVMVGLAFSFTDPNLSALAGQPVHTFNMLYMMPDALGNFANMVPGSLFSEMGTLMGMDARNLAFLVLLIGFAIKVPSVPLHTWLPDAHVEAPTPVSVILAAILLKVGAYGIIRICYGMFPEAGVQYSTFVALLGLASILYGALVAMSQKDFKALIAYSSISHMGFVLLGIASMDAAGLNGAVFQMFNHGIISAALFLIVGVLYARSHDRAIANFKGLWGQMPHYTVIVLIAFFASMGLPGLNGFVSEMLVFLGAFNANDSLIAAWIPILAVLGIVFAAVYYLRTFRKMFFGEYAYLGEGLTEPLRDLNRREYLMLVPLVLLMVLLGVFPSLVLDLMSDSVTAFSSHFVVFVNP